ncbi:hypothetical protein T492DRAFT_957200 [Pavlovales sp. CCMP2436]|nr:hypothetical protein T492DRAFT_957200 [Pavlovales sp. CCMP2436]
MLWGGSARLALAAGAGGLVVGIAVGDLVRVACRRWVRGIGRREEVDEVDGDPDELVEGRSSGEGHDEEETGVDFIDSEMLGIGVGLAAVKFRRRASSSNLCLAKGSRSPRSRPLVDPLQQTTPRRSRLEGMSTSVKSRNSTESMTSPHIEMATENARRMLASERADFRSAETVLYVMGQMTAPEAAQEVERVVTPHEKLHGAFRRVKDELHALHALQDAEKLLDVLQNAEHQVRAKAATIPAFLELRGCEPVPRELTCTDAAQRALLGCERWDFDVFALDRATNGHALVALGGRLLGEKCSSLNISSDVLHAFLSSLEGVYRKDVAYHTATHAADVVHSAAFLFRNGMFLPSVDESQVALLELAVLIAAAAHDAAHPGVNADFLMRTSDPLAVLYNDKSILENMHAAICFRLLSGVESTLLAALEPAQRSQLRTWVIVMILATDMKGHYSLMTELAEIEPWAFDSVMPTEELSFVLGVLLHAADLGGPTKPSTVVRWSRRVAEEFFEQGVKEREHGLKVSEGFDRENSGKLWPQRNAAFINFIVAPLYEAIRAVAPDAALQPIFDGVAGALAALDAADPDMGLDG